MTTKIRYEVYKSEIKIGFSITRVDRATFSITNYTIESQSETGKFEVKCLLLTRGKRIRKESIDTIHCFPLHPIIHTVHLRR